jgi:hypothetical protein
MVQGGREVSMHLLEIGYSEGTYGYKKHWKWPPRAWEYITEVPYIRHIERMYGTC